jgi:enolase-phosphatase E1
MPQPFTIPAGVTHLLLDIEGTTTPIQFVYNVLFPYAKAAIDTFLQTHATHTSVAKWCQQIRAEQPEQSVSATLHQLMTTDAKHPALKALQGMIWDQGYAEGAFVGQVYADVPAAMQRWHQQGFTVGIYSSGSTEAQQLLLRHSNAGDLSPWVSAHFDTAVGHKQQATSYTTLTQQWGVLPGCVLFMSDLAAELDAAIQAGLHGLQLHRADNTQFLPWSGGPMVPSFTGF